MAKKNETMQYISGMEYGQYECPVKWSEDYDCWEIPEKAVLSIFSDPGVDASEQGNFLAKAVRKADLGRYALKVAIEALKQVRENVEFEGYYEQDILKLAEKILKDEYKVNKYQYEQ